MNKISSTFIIILTAILLSSCSDDRKNFQYFDELFQFNNESEDRIIYIYKEPGCCSCNKAMIGSLSNKELHDNEYLLIISHYPYSEQEIDNTLLLKKLFKGNFAIDSTDRYLNIPLIPDHSDVIKL